MSKPARRVSGTIPPENGPSEAEVLRLLAQETQRASGLQRDLERSKEALRAAQALSEACQSQVAALKTQVADLSAAVALPRRRRLPRERQSVTHHLKIGDTDIYLVVGLFPEGDPGEIFLRIAKQGSDLAGWADQFAQLFSLALQSGIPLEDLCRRFVGARFEPSGLTNVEGTRIATSPVDLVARVLLLRYLGVERP